MSRPVSGYRFSCLSGCANCCRKPGSVTLKREDAVRLAAHLGLSIRKFEKTCTERVNGRRYIRMQGPDQRCPFLGGDERHGWCKVHPAKPTQCATYPFWPSIAGDGRTWVQEAQTCPGIGQGPLLPARLVEIQIAAAAAVDSGR